MQTPSSTVAAATLETVHFGEFLRERQLISEEQWLAALAQHWSLRQRSIGQTIVDQGVLTSEVVEAEARAFHEGLDVIEVEAPNRATMIQPLPW